MNIRITVGALVSAMTLIGGFEGYRQIAYLDPVAIPTVCFGATHWNGGKHQRPEQCAALLARDVLEASRVMDCIRVPLTDGQQAALTSWAYNVGVPAACGSTLVRLANAGSPPQVWCAQLNRWNKAHGIVLPGLVQRRAAERVLCEGHAT